MTELKPCIAILSIMFSMLERARIPGVPDFDSHVFISKADNLPGTLLLALLLVTAKLEVLAALDVDLRRDVLLNTEIKSSSAAELHLRQQ